MAKTGRRLFRGGGGFRSWKHDKKKVDAKDDHQQVQSEFDRLAVFRIQECKNGEDAEKLVAGLLVLHDKTDKIDVDCRNDEPGKAIKMKRAGHDDGKDFFDG